MQFKPGDRVAIANPQSDYYGKTGTVETTGGPDELIAVKGLDGRIREAIRGRVGFYPHELRKA